MNKQDFERRIERLNLKASGKALSNGICVIKTKVAGKELKVSSKLNSGKSGKGATTLFFVNGKRTAKADLYSSVYQ